MKMFMPVANNDDDFGYKERLGAYSDSLAEIGRLIPEQREKAWLSIMDDPLRNAEVIGYIALLEKCFERLGDIMEISNILSQKEKLDSGFKKGR